MAVPNPQRKLSSYTANTMDHILTDSGFGSGHSPKVSNYHLDGSISGIEWHSYATMVTEAMKGPKYSINVCKPVPKPTEDSTPSPTHHVTNVAKSLIDRRYV